MLTVFRNYPSKLQINLKEKREKGNNSPNNIFNEKWKEDFIITKLGMVYLNFKVY